MNDELDDLRRANPVSIDTAQRLVVMDRATLIDAIEDDGRSWWAHLIRSIPTVQIPTLGHAGAIAFGAAAFVAITVLAVMLRVDASVVETEIGDIPTLAPPDLLEPDAGKTVGEQSGSPLTTTAPPSPTTSNDTTTSTTTDETATSSSSSTTSTTIAKSSAAEPSSGPATATDPSSASATTATSPTTTSPTTTLAPTTTTTTATTTSTAAPETERAQPVVTIDGPFDPTLDLVALHFDFAHRDDGHAAAAGREIAISSGLDPVVVAGTKGAASDNFAHDYGTMMNGAWGSEWLDASQNRSGAQSASLQRWLSIVDAGGRVWVAEGGVSDFTAELVRELQRARPELDTTAAIRVIQHAGRNESAANPDDLAFVRANTTYQRIDDGNNLNDTADLNGSSGPFETAALSGNRTPRWTVAFEYMSAAELDFSDTVTLLHIVDVGVDQVANADDFAARFMQ